MIASKVKEIKLRSDVPLFLKANGLNNRICEVGVRFGYNLQQLLSCQPELAVAIDHYKNTDNPAEQDTDIPQKKLDKLYRDVFIRYLNYPNVKLLREGSTYAAEIFPLQFFDYIYIDAAHDYNGCIKDLRAWWKRLRQGGLFGGHDYLDEQSRNGVDFGVIQAVDDFIEEKGLKKEHLHHTKEGYRSWFIYKEDGE